MRNCLWEGGNRNGRGRESTAGISRNKEQREWKNKEVSHFSLCSLYNRSQKWNVDPPSLPSLLNKLNMRSGNIQFEPVHWVWTTCLVCLFKPNWHWSLQFTRNISHAYFHPFSNIVSTFSHSVSCALLVRDYKLCRYETSFLTCLSSSILRNDRRHYLQLEFIPKYYSVPLPKPQSTGKTEILPSSNGELCYKLITGSASVPTGLQHGIWSPLRMLLGGRFIVYASTSPNKLVGFSVYSLFSW